ncbi:tRNA pseudouridine(13) synthase TruD [Paraglaciecola aestuariivivens]
MQTSHWLHLYPKLGISAQLKSSPQDFKVTEQLGYHPIGEGEHIYLWVQKIGLNTAYLAEQIAKFTRLPLRSVTYAGRKDKHAQTQQWFSVHCPGKKDFDWSAFNLPGAEIIKAVRHNKKLRTGVLKGNRFEITLRDLQGSPKQLAELDQRLQLIKQLGVPNYYGQQRFGDTKYDTRGGNLVLAEKMLMGEEIRNRNKRSMAISALRSWFFNQCVHSRIQAECFSTPMLGEVLQLAGSQSFFCMTEQHPSIMQRLAERDIFLTAPLWGQGQLASQLDALNFENNLATSHGQITQSLVKLGLKQERRAIQLFANELEWTRTDDTLNLCFSLPAGTFATSVIRELVDVNTDQ